MGTVRDQRPCVLNSAGMKRFGKSKHPRSRASVRLLLQVPDRDRAEQTLLVPHSLSARRRAAPRYLSGSVCPYKPCALRVFPSVLTQPSPAKLCLQNGSPPPSAWKKGTQRRILSVSPINAIKRINMGEWGWCGERGFFIFFLFD